MRTAIFAPIAMVKKRHLWKFAFPTLLAAWLIYALWPRPFEVYVTAPIDDRGTRIKLLVPRGWKFYPEFSEPRGDLHAIDVGASDRPAWWPGFMRRWFPPEDESRNYMLITVYHHRVLMPQRDPLSPAVVGVRVNGRLSMYLASEFKTVAAKCVIRILYYRGDEQAVVRTKDVIFDSVRLVPSDRIR